MLQIEETNLLSQRERRQHVHQRLQHRPLAVHSITSWTGNELVEARKASGKFQDGLALPKVGSREGQLQRSDGQSKSSILSQNVTIKAHPVLL